MNDELQNAVSTDHRHAPPQLVEKKTALEKGEAPRATVRELLGWFDAARRGYRVVDQIRLALDEVDLITVPDFEGEHIDQQIFFQRKPPTTSGPSDAPGEIKDVPDATPRTPETTLPGSSSETNREDRPPAEPSHRLSRLKAANRAPVSVTPNEPLERACTLMLAHDFYQLPVMQNERQVKGLVSWKSIGSRLALGNSCRTVQDCMEPYRELRDDASLFEAVGIIAKHDCVLVRDRERKVVGLVTGADISEQFRLLAEPFLLLGEIENGIRHLILCRFSREDLASACNPADTDRVVESVDDLTFGEYVRLLEKPENWARFAPQIDRVEFTNQLGRIRDIRNNVMHFDPDGITDEDLDELRRFSRFLKDLQTLLQ